MGKFLSRIVELLKGKKTYSLAALAVVYAASACVLGKIGQGEALQIVWEALVASGLRAGMKK